MATVLERLKGFKGGLKLDIKYPTDKKMWIKGARRILQFHYRIQQKELWIRELMIQVRRLSELWQEIGESKFNDLKLIQYKHIETLMSELKDASAQSVLKILDNEADIKIEETREVSFQRCSICSVKLCNPAYIVHRKAGVIVHKSSPIGIHCLHARQGQLEKLVKEIEISLEDESIAIPAAQVAKV